MAPIRNTIRCWRGSQYSCVPLMPAIVVCYSYVLQSCATVVCYSHLLQLCATVACYCCVLLSCATVVCYCRVLLLCATVVCNCCVLWSCAIAMMNRQGRDGLQPAHLFIGDRQFLELRNELHQCFFLLLQKQANENRQKILVHHGFVAGQR